MIIVDSVSKSFGQQDLFENISFKVNRKERIGVVGRNGHGKTTLFRLIAGLEEPDSGTITKPRYYRIGYVQQELEFTEESVMREAAKNLPPEGKSQLWRVEKILAGLGFEQGDLSRHPSELSGGYQVRLNLAKVLLADYQMLLLDEPNNYLDITSIRWLTRFLLGWQGELMLITHDRSFMDKVVTHTLGIHRKKVRKISGDTGKYYAQIARDEEIYEKTRINDERKQKEMDLFISRFRAKARLAGLVQSRIKSLEKMEKKEKLEKIKSLDFSFVEKPFHGKYVMNVSDLSFSYEPDKPLIKNFSLSIGAKDRVFVIGKNGKGKTTLLKLLAGVLKPAEGEISNLLAVTMGYFEQTNVGGLNDSNTVLEEITKMLLETDPKQARNICAAMMFEGDEALKKIRVLSGGEKSRVVLGKLIATPLNLLLLDEPTNHLDMESGDALLAALDNFDGAVVMVTHNEMFLHALAERLVVFQEGGITVYEGDYQRFLEKVGWSEEENQAPEATEEAIKSMVKEKVSRKEMRKLRSEIAAERSRVLKPLEIKISDLEKSIETKEAELSQMNAEIVEASQAKESQKIIELTRRFYHTKQEIDSLFSELEIVTVEYEGKKADLDNKLQAWDEEDIFKA